MPIYDRESGERQGIWRAGERRAVKGPGIGPGTCCSGFMMSIQYAPQPPSHRDTP